MTKRGDRKGDAGENSRPDKKVAEKHGRVQFEPMAEHRQAVRVMAGFGIPHDRIRLAVINQETGRPISKDTLERVFDHELEVGSVEMDLIACTMLAKKVRDGNITAIIWYQKNRMGWRDSFDLSNSDGSLGSGLDISKIPIVKFIFSDEALPNGQPPKLIEHDAGK